jgi:hypothetical protein
MQKTERRSKAGFFRWLTLQKHRQDRVGLLAREVAAPRHWLQRMIAGGPDAREIAHATARAMFEYDKHVAKRPTPQPVVERKTDDVIKHAERYVTRPAPAQGAPKTQERKPYTMPQYVVR